MIHCLYKKLTSILLVLSIFAAAHAGNIVSVVANGATSATANNTYGLEWITSTTAGTIIEKTILVTYENFSGNDKLLFSESSGNTRWEVLFGSSGSNGWQKFCRAAQVPHNGGARTTETVKLRFVPTSTGTFTTSVYIGVGGNCSSFTPTFTINASIQVTNKGVYTWVGTSGIDSTYDRDNNWSPIRTSPATDDILLVDLGDYTNVQKTTIDISGVSEQIGQFLIKPYNHVDFKCTTNAANWQIGATGSNIDGHDFILDTNSHIRFSGPSVAQTGISSSKLTINIAGTNTLDMNGSLTTSNGIVEFIGSGTHRISGNIYTVGGTLSFKPSSTNTLFLDGRSQSLNGTTGLLYIDSLNNVEIGNGIGSTVSTFTLNRTLPLYSVLKINQNTTVVSNSPAGNTESQFNSWVPFLQFKWAEKAITNAYGQLATLPSSSSISGGVLFEIYNSTRRAYRAYGIPLANGTRLSQFADNIHLTGNVDDLGDNQDSFTTKCSYCKSSVFLWNQTTQNWSSLKSTTSGTNLALGQGALIFYRGTKNADWGLGDTSIAANSTPIDFKGQLHTGNTSVTLNLTSGANTSLNGANLIGNPYLSTINLRALYETGTNKNSIYPRFYFYDAISKTYNTWDSSTAGTPGRSGANHFTSNSNGSSGRARFAAPGSAFFVFARNNNATLSFTEDIKTPYSRSITKHFGVQELIENTCNELKIQMRYQEDSAVEQDGFEMKFDIEQSDITNGDDFADVPKFYAGYLGIGSISSNGNWYSIDRKAKLANVGQTYTQALKVAYPKDASKNLRLLFNYCTSGNSSYTIQLLDKHTGKLFTISDNAIYDYSISESGANSSSRFELLFTGIEHSTHVNNAPWQDQIVVYPIPSIDGNIQVATNDNLLISNYSISSMDGKVISHGKLNSNKTIDASALNSGIYLIQLNTNLGVSTKKIQIK